MKALDLIDWAMREAQQLNPDHASPGAREIKPPLGKLLEVLEGKGEKLKPDERSDDHAIVVNHKSLQISKNHAERVQESHFVFGAGVGSEPQTAPHISESQRELSKSTLLMTTSNWEPAAQANALKDLVDETSNARMMVPQEAAFPIAAPTTYPEAQTEQTKVSTELTNNTAREKPNVELAQINRFDRSAAEEVGGAPKTDLALAIAIPLDLQASTPIARSIGMLEHPKTPLHMAIERPDIHTSQPDRFRAIALRWCLRDIRSNRLKLSPVSRGDMLTLIDLGLVEMRDDQPVLTNAGHNALSRR